MNRLCFVMFFFVISLQKVHAMQVSLVQQIFEGHELTAIAILDHSNQREDSIVFRDQKDIIAIFNYMEQAVIVYLDIKNTCKFSYPEFKDLMQGHLTSREEEKAKAMQLFATLLDYEGVGNDDCCIS